MIDDTTTAALDGIATSPVADTVGIQARSYTHPAFEGRTVVRLVRDNLAQVEDLSLGVLGFQPQAEAAVGHVRNRAIGFPAWPIITDPANARHALNLVADLQRAAKLAKSKAGPAKELLDELAKTLGSSAPHFLPTFLEEGARIFLRSDNRTYAAQFFSKAREAERVHNLTIDEERHRYVLLEFALAGALSAKELTLESKSLLERHGAEAALELFVKLNIDRVKGGLPPYAQLPADLRRLAKAAAVPVLEAEVRLLSGMMSAPSLAKAPQAFWDGYIKALISLANQDAEVRASLLELAPDGVRPDKWIDVLEATGIVDELLAGTVDARAWAERYIRKLQNLWNVEYPGKLAQLLRRLPGLRGCTIQLDQRVHNLEPEVLDALLEAGAEVRFDAGRYGRRLNLHNWAHREQRPELNFLAASPHAQLAHSSLPDVAEKHLDVLLAHDGTRAMLGEWATSELPEHPTPGQLLAEIRRLECVLTPAGRAAFPQQTAQLASHLDAASVLADALRDGLVTEYAWPALETAIAELGGKVTFHESWPAVGVAAEGHVIWVQGSERVAQAQFSPTGARDPEQWSYLLVDGVTACRYRTQGYSFAFAWSNDPGTVHQGIYQYGNRWDAQTFPVPGGRLVGRHVARVGDKQDPTVAACDLLTDGERFWSATWEGTKEVDPVTGKAGRESLPTPLADLIAPHLRDGWKIYNSGRNWVPVVPETADSPVVAGNGYHGWINLDRDDQRLGLAADGYTVEPGKATTFVARLRRPGGGHWLLEIGGNLHRDREVAELMPTADEIGAPHWLHDLPRVGWHYARPRDEQASAKLRAATVDQARELLAAVPAAPMPQTLYRRSRGWYHRDEEPGLRPDLVTPQARSAAEAMLGGSDPELVNAVVWAAARVASIVDYGRRRTEAQELAPGLFSAWEPSGAALTGIVGRRPAATSRADARALADRLAGQPAEFDDLSRSSQVTVTRPEVLVAMASRPLADRDFIGGAAAAVGAVLDAGLYRSQGRIFSFPNSWRDDFDAEPGAVLEWPEGRAVSLGRDQDYWSDDTVARFFTVSQSFPSTVGDKPTRLWLESSAIATDQLVAAFEHLLAQGPPAWDPARAERLAEGLGWSQAAAAVLLAGMPGFSEYASNYLPKPVRELLKLKVAEASAAREFLTGLHDDVLIELISAGATDPMRVATQGLDIEAMITYWAKTHGDDIVLPDDLLAEADKAFRWGGAQRVREIADKPTTRSVDHWLWAAYRVRRTDPLAPWLAEQFESIRKACSEKVTDWRDYERQLRPLLGLPTAKPTKGEVHTVGPWTVTADTHSDDLVWDPSLVTDWEQERLLAEALNEEGFSSTHRNRVAVLTGVFDPIQADLRSGADGAPQDPAATAPQVLAEVVATLDLPENAARYWLQLLTLHDPTDRNVDRWNSWKKTDRVKAAAPLVERGLVVEAKRSRAGRSLFLPGGWLEASAPHLPMELWKAPLFDLAEATKVQPVREVVVPAVPLGTLFSDAWQRYRDGDVPGYTQLRTQRYRRR